MRALIFYPNVTLRGHFFALTLKFCSHPPKAYMGHSKNNEANVLQNGPKNDISLIHFNIITAEYRLTKTSPDPSLHAIFLSCPIIFGMTHIIIVVCKNMGIYSTCLTYPFSMGGLVWKVFQILKIPFLSLVPFQNSLVLM